MDVQHSNSSVPARRWARRNAKVAMLVLAATAIGAVLLYFALQVRQELVDLRSAPQDNLHWTLSQLEVDLLVLKTKSEAALQKAKPPCRSSANASTRSTVASTH